MLVVKGLIFFVDYKFYFQMNILVFLCTYLFNNFGFSLKQRLFCRMINEKYSDMMLQTLDFKIKPYPLFYCL